MSLVKLLQTQRHEVGHGKGLEVEAAVDGASRGRVLDPGVALVKLQQT